MQINTIHIGNCLKVLKELPDNSCDCCVTSPPYYGLRDYGNIEQIGLESTPEMYVKIMIDVFDEVRRILKPTGTLWINLGDSYAGSGKGNNPDGTPHKSKYEAKNGTNKGTLTGLQIPNNAKSIGLKPKDLIGIPWMVAFALRSAGWYLRQDIIWHKPNPMPESVTDRCTKAHEYIFLLSKSAKYYYDAESIMKNIKINSWNGLSFTKGKTGHVMDEYRNGIVKSGDKQRKSGSERGCPENTGSNVCGSVPWEGVKANKRSVWTVTTKPFKEAHFATFPEDLIIDCIKAGCPEDGIVFDPFMGAGTVAVVAKKLNRNYVGIELNPEYVKIANKRLYKEIGMFN